MTDLDQILFDAFEDQTRHRTPGSGDPTSIRALHAEVQRRRRRRQTGVATVIVAGAVAATSILATRGDDRADPAVYANDDTSIPTPPPAPTAAGLPTTPDTTPPRPAPDGAAGDLPAWGLTTSPTVAFFSGAAIEVPPAVDGARTVVELGQSNDWRHGPRVAVVLIDRPAADAAPTYATPVADINGRPGYREALAPMKLRTFVDLGDGRSLRITSAEVDESVVAQIVAATTVEGDSIEVGAPPDGLVTVAQTTVDRSTYLRTTQTYVVDESAPTDTLGLQNTVVLNGRDDPVFVAEIEITSPLVQSTDGFVGGEPASFVNAGGSVSWRAGTGWYSLEARPVSAATPQTLLAAVLDSVHPLSRDELDELVIARMSAPSSVAALSYPVDAAATVKIDRFVAALPADFARFSSDPPPPLESDGIRVRGYSDMRDAWIDLTMVPSTVGPPPGDTGIVLVQDLGWSHTLRWRSPSGWTYILTPSLKGDGPAPLSIDESTALLEALDA